jgi:hypothetical protein
MFLLKRLQPVPQREDRDRTFLPATDANAFTCAKRAGKLWRALVAAGAAIVAVPPNVDTNPAASRGTLGTVFAFSDACSTAANRRRTATGVSAGAAVRFVGEKVNARIAALRLARCALSAGAGSTDASRPCCARVSTRAAIGVIGKHVDASRATPRLTGRTFVAAAIGFALPFNATRSRRAGFSTTTTVVGVVVVVHAAAATIRRSGCATHIASTRAIETIRVIVARPTGR